MLKSGFATKGFDFAKQLQERFLHQFFRFRRIADHAETQKIDTPFVCVKKGFESAFFSILRGAQSIRHRATKPKLDDFLDSTACPPMLSVAVAARATQAGSKVRTSDQKRLHGIQADDRGANEV